MALTLRVPALWVFCAISLAWADPNPANWVPARWDGGPLEVARRGKLDSRVQDAIARWYEPSTLDLLDGTPINCLLVTFSTGTASEAVQHQLVKEYARVARARSVAVLGIVYPGATVSAVAAAAVDAQLDGLVLDGEFPAAFVTSLAHAYSGLVIPIARNPANGPVLAVPGVRPSARDLADMGIRAGASAEPWIDSNIWLVRSLRSGPKWRPVWISQEANPASEGDYIRCVADAAVAGGRWMVSLDDNLRVKLFHRNADAMGTWRRMATYLKFAEDHAGWRQFAPFGNVGVVADESADFDEYLNLIARRQVPYRVIRRNDLCAATLAGFRAVAAFAALKEAERKILGDFAETGGVVVTGPSWGSAPKDDPYAEVPLGKGRVVVYKDEPPDPESVAKDLQDLLQPEIVGLSVFNVPSAITYVSTSDDRVLIQVLNYAGRPIERITLRFNGIFKQALLYTPESAPMDLAVTETNNGRTEILIPNLAAWGAVLLEKRN